MRWNPEPDGRFELIAAFSTSPDYESTHLPLVVLEYESHADQNDRWRLLAQSIIYLRLANTLGVRIEFGDQARPVVMACYVTKTFQAEIYILTTMDNTSEVRIYVLVGRMSILIDARYCAYPTSFRYGTREIGSNSF